ncbi:MAG: methyltransferase type 11, partial [Candidatus Nitrosotenuis sp.]
YDVIEQAGFEIKKQESIGHLVYEPFANYYIQNRQELKEKLIQIYSTNVENLVFKSMKKMGQLSKNKIIDYILLSMEKN